MKLLTINDIKIAYKKLKSNIYYDTFSLYNREKLAEFETKGDLDKKLNKLLGALNSFIEKGDINASRFLKRKVKKISYTVLPKYFEADSMSSNIVSNRFIKKTYTVGDYLYLFDGDIELQIIAILWILHDGYKLQKEYQKENYAYKLAIDEQTGEVCNGLRLYEKYHEQYQAWRDNAIVKAKEHIDNDDDVIIIGLDIKSYFYNVRIDFDEVYKSIEITKSPLGNLLEKIHERFHEIMPADRKKNSYEGKGCMLPIGLLSSGVLGNWYLRGFDKKVKQQLSPAYYGRYVDDIMLVLPNTKLEYSGDKKDIFSDFIKTYFVERDLLEEVKNEEGKDGSNENVEYVLVDLKNLSIQQSKFTIYEFDGNESKAILEKFEENIRANSSAFWFLPDDESTSRNFNNSVYDLSYADSVNKLRSVQEIKRSRYGAAVFLAKKIKSSLLVSGERDEEASTQILRFFRGRINLEFYQLWEKVATYFVINNQPEEFLKFFKECEDSIERIEDSSKENDDIIKKLKKAMQHALKLALGMAIALKPNFLHPKTALVRKIKKHFADGEEAINEIIILIEIFRNSNLIRHNYVSFPLINFFTSQESKELHSLVDYRTKLPIKLNLHLEKSTMDWSPRYVYFYEICLYHHYKELLRIEDTKETTNKPRYNNSNLFIGTEESNIFDTAFDDFYKINYEYRYINDSEKNNNIKEQLKNAYFNFCISPSNDDVTIQNLTINNSGKLKKGKLKVAIANIVVSGHDLLNSILDKPNVSIKRRKNFVEVLNATDRIKPNVDLVVLPEASIPYMWLPTLTDEGRKKQKSIIAGLEHITINNVCYNLVATVLPINVGGIKDAIISLRLKNHYSPHEAHVISEYGQIVPIPKPYMYHLFKWRGVAFSVYNCFELADVKHRALFKSKVDLLIAAEYNKDVNYFSNIVESISRDIHCYFIQVNTSNYGDSRITQPSKTYKQDLIRLKGGDNIAVLSTELDILKLRAFQIKGYGLQKDDKDFKPTPPDFDSKEVNKR